MLGESPETQNLQHVVLLKYQEYGDTWGSYSGLEEFHVRSIEPYIPLQAYITLYKAYITF